MSVSWEPVMSPDCWRFFMHPFRAAIEARDPEAVVAALADDVVFRSPIVYKPYGGKAAVGLVIAAVMQVFEDFAYESEMASPDDREHALTFRARIDQKEIEGCDFLHYDRDGQVDRLTVMVRPLSGALALRDRMAALVG
jgi:hypothetical protein